jgi:hypothetical protein
MFGRLAIWPLLALALWPTRGDAMVLFQNEGKKAGWSSLGIQHIGKIDEVAMPTYKGTTALRMEQTFEGLSGYHSEVRLHEAQGPMGSEAYYGMALYLPPNWIFHNQNVTFQQWARGDVFGSPWVLMYVEGDEIRTGGSGGIRGVIAKGITKGTWIRVVTHIRHHPTNGLFEVWVNGVKGLTFTGDVSPAPGAPIRWSSGMYCTRWRAEQPAGLNPMVLFQDHYRVATTQAEADPMSWGEGDGPGPPPPDAGDAVPDAGGDAQATPADAGAPATTPDPGAAPARDAAPDRARPTPADAGGAPGAGEEPEPEGTTPPKKVEAGGCQFGGRAADGRVALLAALVALAWAGRRRAGLAARAGKGTLDVGHGSAGRRRDRGTGD